MYATLVGDSSVPGIGFLDRIHLPLTMRDNVLPRYTEATGTGLPDYEFRQGGIEKSFQKIAVQDTQPIHPWLLQPRVRAG